MHIDPPVIARPRSLFGSLLDLLSLDHSSGAEPMSLVGSRSDEQPVTESGTVLLAPDWSDTPADLQMLRDALGRAGFNVISLGNTFEMSGSSLSELSEAADALLALATRSDPVAVVGHGSGASTVLLALSRRRFAQRAVLIAADAGAPVCDVVPGLGDVGGLLIHSQDDDVSSLHDALGLAESWPGAILARLEGLGHRRILASPATHAAMIRFLGSAAATRLH